MPLFRNTSGRTIAFEVGRERFEVPPGKACEIPKLHTYVVTSRGLPLEPTADASDVVDSTVAPKALVRLPDGVENRTAAQTDDDEDSDVEQQLAQQNARGRRR